MQAYRDFQGCSWIGVPAALYAGKKWEGRIRTQTAYFRREFQLYGNDATMTVRVSGLTRYRLYINGTAVLAGPCKGDRFRHYYEEIDVSKYLRWGKNVIAAKVLAYPPYDALMGEGANAGGVGPESEFGTAAGPCLLVSGEAFGADGLKMAGVNTGDTAWQVCLDDAVDWKMYGLTFWLGSMEVVDGAKIPKGWASAVTTGKWASAERRWGVYRDSTGVMPPFQLKPRPIPLLHDKEISFIKEMPLREDDVKPFSLMGGAVTIEPNTRTAVELDVSYLTTAYVDLPVCGGKGAEVILRYAECYTGDSPTDKGDRTDCVNYRLNGHQDVYYPSGEEEIYNPFWFRTFRFARIEVQTGAFPLTFGLPKLTETGYPLALKTNFTASDENMNKMWEISVRTLQRCMHETYEDCPYYEQLQYIMDTRLQILFTYAVSGDTRMALRTIDDYHASILPEGMIQSRYPTQAPQVIPMFSVHWIFMLEDYYQQTGDVNIPRRYRATADNILDWFARHVDETGLVGQTDYWQFTDWVAQWERGFGLSDASRVGPSVCTNLFYVLGLRCAARMNQLTGRNDAAAAYNADADGILANVQKLCWDNEAGLYREGPGVNEYSQHAQVLAVLTDLTNEPRELMLRTLARDDLMLCSFPWLFYFIRALEKTGLYEHTAPFYQRLSDFAALNATTIPERYYTVRSECHAWGAFPLHEFPRTILGVRQKSVGWKEIEIRPYCGMSEGSEGTVHTPVGDVYVKWEKNGEHVKLEGNVPEGVPCTVILPNGHSQHLENGGVFSL